MDTNNIATAKNIWKWNLGGLGFSNNGVNGIYQTAITQDGKIVADFITTGKLNTSIIEGYGSLVTKVNNIVDITNTIEGNKTIALDNCVFGEILELRIFGNNEVFKHLYPSKFLYPSKTLYPEASNSDILVNDKVYSLGIREVLRAKDDVCDEYILKDGKAKVIRRLSVNEDVIVNSLFEHGRVNINNGRETESDYQARSAMTPVLSGKEYKISKISNSLLFDFICFYNEQNIFISSVNLYSNNNYYEAIITTPENAKYLRVVLRSNNLNAIEENISEQNVSLKLNTDDIFVLDEAFEEDLGTLNINLEEGNNVITIKDYNAKIKAKYVIKNVYTDMYATKVEMSSSITQTAKSIESEVRKKVGNDEIISKINQSAEALRILAKLIDINGVISANGNFKVNTDGTIECTNAKIKVADTGIDAKNCGVVAESTNYVGEYYSDGLTIYNKNIDNADFVIVRTNGITTLDSNRYGFDFWVGSDGRITWTVKDSAGKLLQASDTQFNLWSPGQNTNLMLDSNGAYINGYQIQTNASDRRLKTNIQDSRENALEKIMKIQHRSFDWKENGEHQKNGYIAQELEQIDKEFVINENDKYSINVLNLLSTATKAIQEQQLQIEENKQKIEQLEQEIKNLKGE